MSDVVFTPQMMVKNITSQQGIRVEEVGVAPVVMISWSIRLVNNFAEQIGAQAPKYWPYPDRFPLFTGEINDQRVSLVYVPVGAPVTVTLMEELIALGAHSFIGLGWAGSLQPHAPIGTLFIPNACLREEGTSFHYYPEEVNLSPDRKLVEILLQTAQEDGLQILEGLQWTTDAPYRETLTKIEAYRQRGVIGVDMETSAMYAIGQYRRVRVANLLVISDEIWQEWKPAFRSPQLIAATEQARLIVERSMGKISQNLPEL